MSFGPIRPRFKMIARGTVDDQIARVEAVVSRPESQCVWRVVGNHVDVTIAPAHRHRWSPCVHLELLESDAGTIVNGLIGPHPNVWTLFAFVNITTALAGLFGLMVGLAQLSIGQPAWALWVVPAALLLLVIMYFASQAGQRLAEEQTRLLRALVEEALGSPTGGS